MQRFEHSGIPQPILCRELGGLAAEDALGELVELRGEPVGCRRADDLLIPPLDAFDDDGTRIVEHRRNLDPSFASIDQDLKAER